MTQYTCLHKKPLTKKTEPSNQCKEKTIRKQKPFEWLEKDFNPTRGERALWVAVITQAMMDALSRSQNAEARFHKHEAINWITGNNPGFTLVCLLAGFDPSYIRRKCKRALIAPRPWRAEAGKGKRYIERKAYRERKKNEAEAQKETQSAQIIMGPRPCA